MKKYNNKNKLHSQSRSSYELKHRLKYNDWKRRRNNNKAHLLYQYSINREYKPVSYKAPEVFVLRENTENVIRYIYDIRHHKYKKKSVFINLKHVTKITNGAIALLLSAVLDLFNKNIAVVGNMPIDEICKDKLVKSGFFNHVTANFRKDDGIQDTMITQGDDIVEAHITAPIVRNAMNVVTGARNKNTAIQGMLIELMANTVNHAYPKKKRKKWVLSVNHDVDENKASFSFVDNGVGIINTLKLSFSQSVNSYFSENSDLLKTAFEGKIGSRTGLNYRGRGLPAIFKKFENGKIQEFVVISNDVFIDFTNNRRLDLGTNFEGTYYYWELKN